MKLSTSFELGPFRLAHRVVMPPLTRMTATDAATLTSFSHIIAALQQRADHFTIALPSDWLQGRTAYGGLSAALCLEATLRRFPDLPPLRSAQFAFVGPATGALRIAVTMLRRGKSTVFASA